MPSPTDLNAVLRLVMLADRYGPQLLDDAEHFDSILGPGRFAALESDALSEARRIVKARGDGVAKVRA
jgi:hypothetical protein